MLKKTTQIRGKFVERPTVGSPAIIACSGMEGKLIKTSTVVHCQLNADGKTGWVETKNSFYTVKAPEAVTS